MEYLENWIEDNYDNKGSIIQYRSYLKKFFDFVGVGAEEYVERYRTVMLENDQKKIDEIEEEYQKNVKDYNAYLKKSMAPVSIPNRLAIVRTFLEDKKIRFGRNFWKQLKRRGIGTEVLTDDRIPTVDELKLILSFGDVRDRAYFLTLLSSGLRPDELCNLSIDCFDLDHNPPMIHVPARLRKGKYTKTYTKRTTFMSNEAKEAIKAWLKIRERASLTSLYKSHFNREIAREKGFDVKKVNEKWQTLKDGVPVNPYEYISTFDRLFPFSTVTANTMWRRLLKKAELDKEDKDTGHDILHKYVLRKFFNTRLKDAIDSVFVEQLMGHKTPYDKKPVEELGKLYLQGMDRLMVFERPANQQEIETLKDQLTDIQSKMNTVIRQSDYFMQKYVDDIGTEIEISDKELIDKYLEDEKLMEYAREYGIEALRIKLRKQVNGV